MEITKTQRKYDVVEGVKWDNFKLEIYDSSLLNK